MCIGVARICRMNCHRSAAHQAFTLQPSEGEGYERAETERKRDTMKTMRIALAIVICMTAAVASSAATAQVSPSAAAQAKRDRQTTQHQAPGVPEPCLESHKREVDLVGEPFLPGQPFKGAAVRIDYSSALLSLVIGCRKASTFP